MKDFKGNALRHRLTIPQKESLEEYLRAVRPPTRSQDQPKGTKVLLSCQHTSWWPLSPPKKKEIVYCRVCCNYTEVLV